MSKEKTFEEQFAEYLSGSLWDCSAIRHGMFSPPRFRAIAEPIILAAINKISDTEVLAKLKAKIAAEAETLEREEQKDQS